MAAMLLAACDIPFDAADTTATIQQQGVLIAGWVVPSSIDLTTRPSGVEAAAVRAVARHMGVDVEWRSMGIEELLHQIENREIHLLAAGLSVDAPRLGAHVGRSRPFCRGADQPGHILLTPAGENRWLKRVDTALLELNDETCRVSATTP